MNQEKIGKFIQEMRKQKKMTQQELAERLGVSDKSVSRWENGNNLPDASLYNSLCEELDISINELLSGQKLEAKEYQKKLEENIILLNENTKKKLNKKIIKLIISIIIILLLFATIGFTCVKIFDYYDSKKIYLPVTDVHYEVCKYKPNTSEEQIIIKSTTNDGTPSIVTAKQKDNNIVIQNFKYEKWKKHPELSISHTRITPTGKVNQIYYADTLIFDGKEPLKECIESRGLTLTYEVVNKEISDDTDDIYYYITIKKYNEEDLYKALLQEKYAKDIKIGKSYEFTFNYTMTTFLRGKTTTRDIFESLELLSVKETNKTGLDQINDEIF